MEHKNVKEEQNDYINKKEDEYKNMIVKCLTGIAGVLTIGSTFVFLVNILLSYKESGIVDFSFINVMMPILYIIGMVLLIFITIKYPNKYWSKQLIKISITIVAMTVLLYFFTDYIRIQIINFLSSFEKNY